MMRCGRTLVYVAVILFGVQGHVGGSQKPIDMESVVAELRSLRAAIEDASALSVRLQVLAVRMSRQQERIVAVARRLDRLSDSAAAATIRYDESVLHVKELESALSPARNDPAESERRRVDLRLTERELARAEAQRDQAIAKHSDTTNELAREEGQLMAFEQLLVELESALPARRR
ncbi:MAG TPA: hypothetical protein VNJ02_18565 [Vicinamibacterales bacterium]|nr:hypothetical protein [Vicinamibacterales bacterium]